jgi:putative hemolysin
MVTPTLICELLLLISLLAGSAFFSGAEIALFSLSKLQLRRLRQDHPKRGQLINELLDRPHQLLSTILLGNTVASVCAATVGYTIIETFWPSHAEALSVPVMTVLILVFGEITPKTLVIRRPEVFALRLAGAASFTVRSTKFIRRLAEAVSGAMVKRIERIPYFASRKARTSAPTEEEYRTLLNVSELAGIVRREERTMVNKILALEQMQLKEIMTPRVDMQCVEDSMSREEMAAELRKIKHRRVPVIHESADTVEGILNVKDFLIDPSREFDEVIELPNFVPETMGVAKLLKSFRKQEHPVAIVVDEYGGTQGMVTLEDILEEIVGEIQDEFDPTDVMVQKLDARHYLINGKARIEEVNEQCHLKLEAVDVDTIAGWMIAQLGSLPREGDQVKSHNVTVIARKVTKNRVREVLLEIWPDGFGAGG